MGKKSVKSGCSGKAMRISQIECVYL